MRKGLTPGKYYVKAYDALGCMRSDTVSVFNPGNLSFLYYFNYTKLIQLLDLLKLTVTPVHVSCFGVGDGAINVLASGGTGPYQVFYIMKIYLMIDST